MFDRDGNEIDDEVVPDGGRVSMEAKFMDHKIDYAAIRRAYRLPASLNDLETAAAAAYEARSKRLQDSWKQQPQQVDDWWGAGGAMPSQFMQIFRAFASEQPASTPEAAYNARSERLRQAWKLTPAQHAERQAVLESLTRLPSREEMQRQLTLLRKQGMRAFGFPGGPGGGVAGDDAGHVDQDDLDELRDRAKRAHDARTQRLQNAWRTP